MERAFFAGARAGHDARNVVADNDCRGVLPSFLPSLFFPFSSSILSHLCLYSPRAPGNSFSFSFLFSFSVRFETTRKNTHDSSSILSHLCLYSPRAPGNSLSFLFSFSVRFETMRKDTHDSIGPLREEKTREHGGPSRGKRRGKK